MKSLLIIINFLLFSISVFAQNKVYTVGVEDIYFLPYSNVENNKYVGIFKNILDEFAKKNNIEFKYIPLPIVRLYTEFFNEKVDFKIPENPAWQLDAKKKRKLNITYSEPVLDYIDGVFVNSKLELNELKKLGAVTGFTTFEYNDLINSEKVKKSENPDIDGLIKQLILGRIDAAYINIVVGKYYLINNLKKPNIVNFAENLPHTKDHYHLGTIKHPEVIKQFNQFLKNEINFMNKIRGNIQLK